MLGGRLGIPVVHLDRLWWKPGWVHVGAGPFRERLTEIAKGERWVIEGHKTPAFDVCLPRADTIIVIEQPRLVCMWRAVKRTVTHIGRTRPDIGPGCREKLDPGFYRYIWEFSRKTAPAAESAISQYGRRANILRLRSDREIDRFVSGLSTPGPAHGAPGIGVSIDRNVPRRIVIVSRHDYRTRKKAGIHFIARAFAAQGAQVQFISIGFSALSLLRRDPRSFLFMASNRWVMHDDISCFLWRTALHPFRRGLGAFASMTSPWYDSLARTRSAPFDEAVAAADLIVIESGIGPIFIDRVRVLAPAATITYLVSDLLETVGVHSRVQQMLEDNIGKLDSIAIVARGMASAFRGHEDKLAFIPHGVDSDALSRPSRSPYRAGRHAVSVGSMLFDPRTIHAAAAAFPDVTFHIIGANRRDRFPSNVVTYPEMPFAKTIPYLQHADVGIAPYRWARDAEYLGELEPQAHSIRRPGSSRGVPALCGVRCNRPLRLRARRSGFDRRGVSRGARVRAGTRHAISVVG